MRHRRVIRMRNNRHRTNRATIKVVSPSQRNRSPFANQTAFCQQTSIQTTLKVVTIRSGVLTIEIIQLQRKHTIKVSRPATIFIMSGRTIRLQRLTTLHRRRLLRATRQYLTHTILFRTVGRNRRRHVNLFSHQLHLQNRHLHRIKRHRFFIVRIMIPQVPQLPSYRHNRQRARHSRRRRNMARLRPNLRLFNRR